MGGEGSLKERQRRRRKDADSQPGKRKQRLHEVLSGRKLGGRKVVGTVRKRGP